MIVYSLNMNDILTVSIITPTVDGGFKRWEREISLEFFKYSRVPFYEVDLQLGSAACDAVNLEILEDHPDSSVAIYIRVKLDQLIYEFRYDMAYGGGDKNYVMNNIYEPPNFYRYLKTRLMITAGIIDDVIDRYEWSRCIYKDRYEWSCLLEQSGTSIKWNDFVDKDSVGYKLYEKLYV